MTCGSESVCYPLNHSISHLVNSIRRDTATYHLSRIHKSWRCRHDFSQCCHNPSTCIREQKQSSMQFNLLNNQALQLQSRTAILNSTNASLPHLRLPGVTDVCLTEWWSRDLGVMLNDLGTMEWNISKHANRSLWVTNYITQTPNSILKNYLCICRHLTIIMTTLL